MSGPGSLYNYPALSYKRTGQPLKSDKFSRALDNTLKSEDTRQYNSSGCRVLRSGGLKHLKIFMST
jgi:hypothetical protein